MWKTLPLWRTLLLYPRRGDAYFVGMGSAAHSAARLSNVPQPSGADDGAQAGVSALPDGLGAYRHGLQWGEADRENVAARLADRSRSNTQGAGPLEHRGDVANADADDDPRRSLPKERRDRVHGRGLPRELDARTDSLRTDGATLGERRGQATVAHVVGAFEQTLAGQDEQERLELRLCRKVDRRCLPVESLPFLDQPFAPAQGLNAGARRGSQKKSRIARAFEG